MIVAILAIVCQIILPPCASEDSLMCYWDASESGNGVGHDVINLSGDSFIIIPDGEK